MIFLAHNIHDFDQGTWVCFRDDSGYGVHLSSEQVETINDALNGIDPPKPEQRLLSSLSLPELGALLELHKQIIETSPCLTSEEMKAIKKNGRLVWAAMAALSNQIDYDK